MIFYTSRIFHLKVLYCTVDPSSIKYSGNKTAAKMLSCSMKTLNFSSFYCLILSDSTELFDKFINLIEKKLQVIDVITVRDICQG